MRGEQRRRELGGNIKRRQYRSDEGRNGVNGDRIERHEMREVRGEVAGVSGMPRDGP